MPSRYTAEAYGPTALALHWASAAAIILLLISGQVMDAIGGAEAASGLLVAHVLLGVTALLLTLVRLVWFFFIDRWPRPYPGLEQWQEILSRLVHGLLYVVTLLLASSGIATLILSGAAEALFTGQPVPDVERILPRQVHGLAARAMLALLALHVGAALWHIFIRRDGVGARMGLAKRPAP
jgi:cytochrome b561